MAAALKKNQKLPDPFAMHDGTRIASKAAWACRRNEINVGAAAGASCVAIGMNGNSALKSPLALCSPLVPAKQSR
jgi:hypothetical protein